MYNIRNQRFTGTQKSVYIDSTGSKLEEASLLRTMLIPHYQRFDSHSEAGFSITVHNLPAATLEQSVVAGTMPFTHSTAMSAPLRSVVGIESCESDSLVKASSFKGLLEEQDRYSQDLLVEPSALGPEPLEVFDSDVSIIFESQLGDLFDNLAYAVLDEVLLFCPEPSQGLDSFMASFVSEGAELAPSLHNTLPFNPNVLAEVELFKDFAFRSEDADSKALAIDINPDYVLSSRHLSFRAVQESDYLSAGSQAISLTCPAVAEQVLVSLPIAVLPERDSYTLFGPDAQLNEVITKGEGSCISGDVELDSNCVESMSLGIDNTAFNITNHLTIEGGLSLGC